MNQLDPDTVTLQNQAQVHKTKNVTKITLNTLHRNKKHISHCILCDN